MNGRVVLLLGVLVLAVSAAGAAADGDGQSTDALVEQARDATDGARAMIELADRPWAARGVGAGVGVALGLAVGGTAAFAFYRRSI